MAQIVTFLNGGDKVILSAAASWWARSTGSCICADALSSGTVRYPAVRDTRNMDRQDKSVGLKMRMH
jgi:hypothetical protein